MQIKNSDQNITGSACIITGGLIDSPYAKTTHGLLRSSTRFEIKGIIDDKFHGHDAGEFLDEKTLGIPIYESIGKMIQLSGEKPKYAIIGMATKGGILPSSLYPVIKDALSQGINVVNGLHQPLSEVEELKDLAIASNAVIYDIRRPKPFRELHFWNGKIHEIECLKIAVLGTDCAVGKRTTSKLLTQALVEAGIKAEMIYTGQTGWLQGTKYGFIFDATANDFIPGELEHAMHECWLNEHPEVMVIEGQASLLNPSGPCGSDFIISAKADGIFLQHNPFRKKYNGLDHLPDNIPSVKIDMEIIKLLGGDVWGLTLHTSNMDHEQIVSEKVRLEKESGLPVISPLTEGVKSLVEIVKNKLDSKRTEY